MYYARYEAVTPPDDTYGAPFPNGSWSGIVGMVMKGVSNIINRNVYAHLPPTNEFAVTNEANHVLRKTERRLVMQLEKEFVLKGSHSHTQ
jgi:hypothetical protein